jgi:L-amino acid N-acyltransferase YncA
MMSLVRKAVTADAKQVADVINAVIAEGEYTVFDRPFSVDEERRFIASLEPRCAMFVVEVDGVIAGVQVVDLLVTFAQSMSHVATLGTWLRSDIRGQGIGRLLAAESMGFAERHDFRKIVINVFSHNERALRFYRGLGFTDIGIARKHVRLGDVFHDEVYLEKQLT